MYKQIGTIYRTLCYLKISQIFYQFKFRLGLNIIQWPSMKLKDEYAELKTFRYLKSSNSFETNPYRIEFLNQKVSFGEKIDWRYSSNGKLWNYNLNYFDFITNPSSSPEEITKIIHSYFNQYKTIKDGKEPYPTSLRIINLIKINNQFNSQELRYILKNDIRRLYGSLEYHVHGNHLLENGFALYFASHLFPNNKKLTGKAIKLLKEQLNEQILPDGAHYERSFMYHKIILGRLLDSISLSISNSFLWNKEMLPFLEKKAQLMIQWMKNISNNGENFVRFNDSVEGIGPRYGELIKLASRLVPDIESEIKLNESGYRSWHLDNFFIVMNVGEITPKYQPGHSHADTLSFTVHYKGVPLLVDPGISTYQESPTRLGERSTINHNTVTVNSSNNNEVWGSFRVGRRAKTKILNESDYELEATHDGFKSFNIYHLRKWERKENEIRVIDSILGAQDHLIEAHFHFHPSTVVDRTENSLFFLNNQIQFEISNYETIEIKEYEYCLGFNHTTTAKKVTISFKDNLIITIRE